jgi:NADH-quinone oxidoreductase subunit C
MSAKPPEPMAATPWDHPLAVRLRDEFPGAIRETATYLEQPFVVVEPRAVPEVLRFLRDRETFDLLVDLTAVDYPKSEARFEIVYHLYSFQSNERLRIKTRVFETESPPSLTGVFAAANWLEREVYDMFGIEFHGHPDLRRILLPDEWHGFPLRKDSSILGMDQRWVKENLGIESGQ